MNWYGLPIFYRILFISSSLLAALYLALRVFKATEMPPIPSTPVKKPTPYCEQMTLEEYERVGKEYTKEQLKKLESSPEFKKHVQNSEQQIRYCGVGAHFQNGIAENLIKRPRNLSFRF